MDRSIRFYTEVLELRLTNRLGNNWATVSTGEGITIGILPASAKYPALGTISAIMVGLDIDVPIEKAIARLTRNGAQFKSSVVRSEPGNFVNLEDPDRNKNYLWEKTSQGVSESAFAVSSVS